MMWLKIGKGGGFLWVPSSVINFLIRWGPVRFSRRTLFSGVT